MRALLINPNYGETFLSYQHALKMVSKKAVMPPLGLLTAAALLPEAWEKRLVDMNARQLREEDLKWAEMVFISAYQMQETSAREVIKRCHAARLKIVAGGPLFYHFHSQFPDVDHFLLLEAELTLPRFLQDLAQGRAQRMYLSESWADMAQSPMPLWQLVPFEDYFMMNLQYSRGCPYQCEYCGVSTLNGRKFRYKTPEQICRELEVFAAAGWRMQVMFVDDNIIGNRQYLKTQVLPVLIDWMKKKRYPFTFITQASIDLADDEELMQLLVQAGFTTVFIGIESLNEASLIECSKTQNRHRDLLASVKKIQAHGLEVQGGFMVGFDHDSPEVFKQQENFVQESGIVTAMMSMIKPIPGTRWFERLKQENRLGDARFEGEFTSAAVAYVPKSMSAEALKQGFVQMVSRIYSPAQTFIRLKKFMKNYRRLSPAGPPPMTWASGRTLGKVVITLGVLARERRYYLRLFFWTLFHYPRNLRLIMTLAVFGYNYRKTYETVFKTAIR